jgi:hypothetical protein
MTLKLRIFSCEQKTNNKRKKTQKPLPSFPDNEGLFQNDNPGATLSRARIFKNHTPNLFLLICSALVKLFFTTWPFSGRIFS